MRLNLPEIEPLGRDAEGHIEDPYARGQYDRDRQIAKALREYAAGKAQETYQLGQSGHYFTASLADVHQKLARALAVELDPEVTP